MSGDHPHEQSLVIATFFALGAAWRHASLEGGIVRLSGYHGKLDELFGDAAFGINGRHVLIEFKADASTFAREIAKPRRTRLLKQIGDDARLRALSRRCHVLAYGALEGPVYQPYANLRGENWLNDQVRGLEAFVGGLSEVESNLGVPPQRGTSFEARWDPIRGVGIEEFVRYLTNVANPWGSEAGMPARITDEYVADASSRSYWLSYSPECGLASAPIVNHEDLVRLIVAARAREVPKHNRVQKPDDPDQKPGDYDDGLSGGRGR